jgi:hypothetical protein
VTLLVQRPGDAVLEAVPFPARAGNALMSIVAYAGRWSGRRAVADLSLSARGIPLWQPMGARLLVGASVARSVERERARGSPSAGASTS